MELKAHWEKVYTTKQLNEVSWYQPVPVTSLELIHSVQPSKVAKIIDIGGGDSYLSEHLIEEGFTNLTVLDISQASLDRAAKRLRHKADRVTWICSDINDFQPTGKYDLWHDRAAFHFLTDQKEIENYVSLVSSFVEKGGYLILGTFSEVGPLKCSGLQITRYSQESMRSLFSEHFEPVSLLNQEHPTPFDTTQDFTFGAFRRK